MRQLLGAALLVVSSSVIVSGDEISVNSPYWKAITQQEQQEILDTLRASKVLNPDDVLRGTPQESGVSELTDPEFKIKLPKIKVRIPGLKEVCQAACDVTAATASAACGGSAIGVAACQAATGAAHAHCRSRC